MKRIIFNICFVISMGIIGITSSCSKDEVPIELDTYIELKTNKFEISADATDIEIEVADESNILPSLEKVDQYEFVEGKDLNDVNNGFTCWGKAIYENGEGTFPAMTWNPYDKEEIITVKDKIPGKSAIIHLPENKRAKKRTFILSFRFNKTYTFINVLQNEK